MNLKFDLDVDRLVRNVIHDAKVIQKDMIPRAVNQALPRALGRGGRGGVITPLVRALAGATRTKQKLMRGRIRLIGRFEVNPLLLQTRRAITLRTYSDDMPASVTRTPGQLATLKNPARATFAGRRFPNAFWARIAGGKRSKTVAQRLRANPTATVKRDIFVRKQGSNKILKAKIHLDDKMGPVVRTVVRSEFKRIFAKELRDSFRFQALKARGKLRGRLS